MKISAVGVGLLVALSVVNLNALASKESQPAPLNVKEFGAKGDGVNDDASAFQAALTKADPATGGCGSVLVPASDKPYLLGSPISVPSGATLQAVPGSAVLAPVISPSFPSKRPSSAPVLLSIKNASNVTIRGLTFDGCVDRIDSSAPLVMVFQSERVIFEQDEVRNSRGIGILFSGGQKGITYSGLQNCHFENIGKRYIETRDKKLDRRQSVSFCCAAQNSAGEFLNQHNFVKACQFGYNGFDNLSLGQQSYFTVSDSHFGGSHNGGNIYCSHSRHIRILNNKLKGASGNGIDCFVNEDLTITGNESSFNGAAGIMAADTHCGLIADNKTICNYQSVNPAWQAEHPDVHGSSHRGGITIGGESGDGKGTAERGAATAPGGSRDILIKNNLSGDNQAAGQRTQAFGIQVRTTASAENVLVTPDNRLFGNTQGPFGQQLTGFSGASDSKLRCTLWSGEN